MRQATQLANGFAASRHVHQLPETDRCAHAAQPAISCAVDRHAAPHAYELRETGRCAAGRSYKKIRIKYFCPFLV